MKKLRLMTIVGTRPELIRLSETIKKADSYFEHVFVHTGQNYDYNLNEIFYQDLRLREPDHYLNAVGADLGTTIGNIIAKSYAVMREVKPDAVLILGDTNSALSAISAKRLKIPIFHMEAGNRCFDENLPEETNRRIVDHISDVNMAYTEHARRNLLAEGIRSERVFVTGSPMAEVIAANNAGIDASDVLDSLGVSPGNYFVLSAHREENIDNPDVFSSLMAAVNILAERYGMPVIYSVHPRTAKFIKERGFKFNDLVRAHPPFAFTHYSKLMWNAYCVVSDSGTLPEEAAIRRFPAVSIRTSTERPEAVDKGAVVLGGVDASTIIQAIDLAVSQSRDAVAVPDYEIGTVSSIALKIVMGYVDVINRNVWRKTGG